MASRHFCVKRPIFEIQSLITAAIGLSGLVFGDAARSPFADILSEETDNSAEGETEKK